MENLFKNIALEGTRNGDVVGGLYREPGKTFERFCFLRKEEKTMKLISDILGPGEKPSVNQIIDEIDMVFMQPFRTAYDILASDDSTTDRLKTFSMSLWDIGKNFRRKFHNVSKRRRHERPTRI